MSISLFEHVQELQLKPDPEAPHAQKTRDQYPHLKAWKTLHRKNAKLYLAHEVRGLSSIEPDVLESLRTLLHHPNLVNLVEIIEEESEGGINFVVWDYCDLGPLSQVLRTELDPRKPHAPESLCWHVLEGISRALIFLHEGRSSLDQRHQLIHAPEDDWQPVMVVDINPTNIFFTSPQGDDAFGTVKLGGFGSAVIRAAHDPGRLPDWIKPSYSEYMPPEISTPHHPWSPASDIWALGAVLYKMMVGQHPSSKPASGRARPRPSPGPGPATRSNSNSVSDSDSDDDDNPAAASATSFSMRDPARTHRPPKRSTATAATGATPARAQYRVEPVPSFYSGALAEMAYGMLAYHPTDRPTAHTLCYHVKLGVAQWRAGLRKMGR
ncbi:MAG: hypothetical protein M1826_004659 [Phylliscum demangeonii]|nr:MAG: hypothetical protein M1826_004659 [Phylliscum demangeonii]